MNRESRRHGASAIRTVFNLNRLAQATGQPRVKTSSPHVRVSDVRAHFW